MRTVTRAPRVCSIAMPLLVVSTSLDEATASGQLFGSGAGISVLGVFGNGDGAERVIDLRDVAAASTLARTSGERNRTTEIAALIGGEIERVGAATVAIGLGLRGGDPQEASDAALLARRRARARITWLVYVSSDVEADAGRIARRRMQLFVRGIRLEPVAVAEAPMGSSARFWEIRPSQS